MLFKAANTSGKGRYSDRLHFFAQRSNRRGKRRSRVAITQAKVLTDLPAVEGVGFA